MVKKKRAGMGQEAAQPAMHSFHIQLPPDVLRMLRVAAAERGTSAGRLARELLVRAMAEEGRKRER
jgi:hypothetical protein